MRQTHIIACLVIGSVIIAVLVSMGRTYEAPKTAPTWEQLQERIAEKQPDDFNSSIKTRILIDEALNDNSGTSLAWQKIRLYYLKQFVEDMRRKEFLRSLEYDGQKGTKLR